VSKRTYFLLIHTIVTMEKTAELFLYYVWKLHRLLQRVVLDQSPQFVVLFTRELY